MLHNYSEGLKTRRRDVVKIVSSGVGAGAADLTGVDKSTGVLSIVHTGTGLYTVNFDDKFYNFLCMNGVVADVTAPGAWDIQLASAPGTNINSLAIQVFKANVLTDLTTDETLFVEFSFSSTSRPN